MPLHTTRGSIIASTLHSGVIDAQWFVRKEVDCEKLEVYKMGGTLVERHLAYVDDVIMFFHLMKH